MSVDLSSINLRVKGRIWTLERMIHNKQKYLSELIITNEITDSFWELKKEIDSMLKEKELLTQLFDY